MRFFIELSYKGTNYHGWQMQPNANSVQAEINNALSTLLNTKIEKYDIPKKTVFLEGDNYTFDIIVNTISPDILFDYCYGELPYIGRDFHKIVFPTENVFPDHVYFLYYANEEKFTRLVEYKKFTQHDSPTTLIGMEIPSKNGKYYPMPIKKEMEKAEGELDAVAGPLRDAPPKKVTFKKPKKKSLKNLIL